MAHHVVFHLEEVLGVGVVRDVHICPNQFQRKVHGILCLAHGFFNIFFKVIFSVCLK